MKIPWDDYDAYCQKVWKEAEEHWREGTRQLQAHERVRVAWEARQRELQEEQERLHKENARARQAEREEREAREAELFKENARAHEAQRVETAITGAEYFPTKAEAVARVRELAGLLDQGGATT